MSTHQLTEREAKALEIANRAELVCKDGLWIVPSQSSSKNYTVNPDPSSLSCTCPDFESQQRPCKHALAVNIVLGRGNSQTQTATENGYGQKEVHAGLAELQPRAANREVTLSRVALSTVLQD